MKDPKNRALAAGLALIALGLAVYFLRTANIGLGHGYITIFIAGAFLAGYFWTKHDGLLVPGCLLMSFGIGSIGQRSFLDWDRGDLIPIGLGFIAIFLVKLAYERQADWWPVIPGGLLLLGGLVYMKHWLEVVARNWPLLLVGIGVLVVVGALVRKKDPESA